MPDSGTDAVAESAPPDAGNGDVTANDAAMSDAADSACPEMWTAFPAVPTSIAVPSDGGSVILHAVAAGSQDYTCRGDDAGGTPFTWTFVGPEAELKDCHGLTIGHHFASDAGATAPEWQTSDGTFVIAKKVGVADGGTGNVPWLLLQATAHGGAGTLSNAGFIQRVNTGSGTAPSTTCDGTVNGTTQKMPYTADYYFFGP